MLIPGIVASAAAAAGGPTELFYAEITPVSTPNELQFGIDVNCDVDWGDGNFVPEAAGTVVGDMIGPGNVIIKTNNTATTFSILSLFAVRLVVEELHIPNSSSLTDVSNLCGQSTVMTSVSLGDGSGITNFSGGMINCTALTSFAITNLDLSLNEAFNLMFNGCTSLVSLPAIDTSGGTNFTDMFNGCTALTCLSTLNTTSQTFTTNMFLNTPALVAPNGTEQTSLLSGSSYTNGGTCP